MAGVSAHFAAVKCEENIGCKNARLVLPLFLHPVYSNLLN